MCLLYVCAYQRLVVYALINGIIIRKRVYLIESDVGGRLCHICKRVRPLLFVRAFNLHTKTETKTVLLRAFRVGLPCLFVGQLAIQGSLESGASARAIFVTHKHRSTNSICNKRMR